MTEIYEEVAKLSYKLRMMSYQLTTNKTDIDNAVQELMLYFLEMNQHTLRSIYEKDGVKGLTNYGAVVMYRALTSTRSPFYYKYKKYYDKLDGSYTSGFKDLEALSEEEVEATYEKLDKIDKHLEKMHWYDRDVFMLYYYGGNTLTSLAEKTDISRNSLFSTIKKVREQLRNEIK